MKHLFIVFLFTLSVFHLCSSSTAAKSESSAEADPAFVQYELKGNNVTLTWQPKPALGYQITIENYEINNETLHLYYSLHFADPATNPLQVTTYPQAVVELPVTDEEIEDVQLFEVRDSYVFKEHRPPVEIKENKIWNIDFSSPVVSSAINNETVHIVDDDNNPVDTVILLANNREVKILPPEGGYEPNKLYSLYVAPSITNQNGVEMEHGFKQTFYTGLLKSDIDLNFQDGTILGPQPSQGQQEEASNEDSDTDLLISFANDGEEEEVTKPIFEEEFEIIPLTVGEEGREFIIHKTFPSSTETINEDHYFFPLQYNNPFADSMRRFFLVPYLQYLER
ncbi:hypothetical protein [Bacillus sp. FJAT-44742]|uniref:hypothetical protein n=1 Tax=Bacillus sp. FJAT-44742 TaxID=2014005 RepID=UPI000C23D3F5|nr:hypothetical protein [Bacillus sp. FJAT-44742]